AARDRARVVAGLAQVEADEVAEVGLVVDDEDGERRVGGSGRGRGGGRLRRVHGPVLRMARRGCQPRGAEAASAGDAGAAAGSVTRKVEPAPTVDETLTSPPCAWTRCLTIARPSPVPPSSRERAG